MSNIERMVLATFCDDIRYEIGNKHSLIGCYKQDLVVGAFPAMLPKLCAAILVVTPVDRPFEKLTISANLGDENLGELELHADQLQAAKSETLIHAKAGMKKVEVYCHLTFSPVMLNQAATLRIEAITEDEIIKGSVLQIRSRVQDEQLSLQEKK